mmetsp:Transcript_31039/g.34613  ORF Transcript_31039/g.34613 Transcript_31039/m.34613 type:complete len:165 (-) Transcript_31039:178-672(-)|eukprot:CAMPEP_0168527386 /NCGR_PEP_ID=MMETSP0405-20121227/12571_1 /TAXON_ID=498012 /ORGANISM="Trichosphaerium sp, Strain Am-I-7 wt" /LENGTH=164 /DNA_ID=CAMNT_0008550487 /DNA_START=84 /DNA_END=578 /DNA_ORIENTATION=+
MSRTAPSRGGIRRKLPKPKGAAPPRGDDREIFSLWDVNGDGTILKDVVGDVLRAVGKVPTEAEVAKLTEGVGGEEGKVTYDEFSKIASQATTYSSDMGLDVRQAYAVFDQRDDGNVISAEVETAFSSIGEKLNDHEVEDLMQYADPGEKGLFAFETWVKAQETK